MNRLGGLEVRSFNRVIKVEEGQIQTNLDGWKQILPYVASPDENTNERILVEPFSFIVRQHVKRAKCLFKCLI